MEHKIWGSSFSSEIPPSYKQNCWKLRWLLTTIFVFSVWFTPWNLQKLFLSLIWQSFWWYDHFYHYLFQFTITDNSMSHFSHFQNTPNNNPVDWLIDWLMMLLLRICVVSVQKFQWICDWKYPAASLAASSASIRAMPEASNCASWLQNSIGANNKIWHKPTDWHHKGFLSLIWLDTFDWLF